MPKLLLSGTTTAKQTVKLYDVNTSVGSAVANEDGKWSIKLDKELTIGSHFLQLGLFDNDGKELARSQSIRIIIATPLTVQIEPGSMITISSSITNSGMISGTAHPSLTVKISEDNTLVITTSVDAIGTWQWGLPTSTVTGTHAYQFIQLDLNNKEIGNPVKRTITIGVLPLPSSGADLSTATLTTSGIFTLALLILASLKVGSRLIKLM